MLNAEVVIGSCFYFLWYWNEIVMAWVRSRLFLNIRMSDETIKKKITTTTDFNGNSIKAIGITVMTLTIRLSLSIDKFTRLSNSYIFLLIHDFSVISLSILMLHMPSHLTSEYPHGQWSMVNKIISPPITKCSFLSII